MKKQKTTRYKGGGGGGNTSTTSTIPEWAVPYLQRVGNEAESQYGSGNLSQVAGSNPLLQTAFGSGAQAIGDTTTLGSQARDIEQQTGDANWQALQRYASTIYGNPARQQTVATGGGGGK